MSTTTFIINMDDVAERQKLAESLRPLRGRQRIEVTAYRPRRSDRQNRYYWPCFVKPLGDYMREHGFEVDGRVPTDDDAHEYLKHKFLPLVDVANTTTGELEQMRGSTTTTLTTTQFNEYLDRVAQFLAEHCGFVVPDPDKYHERNEEELVV